MIYIIAGLAVYKIIQLADALSPREAMPWVKILLTVLVSIGAAFVIDLDGNPTEHVVAGFSIATLAGATHTLLRLLTLTGDMAQRRSMK
jgi:hypothetical protein